MPKVLLHVVCETQGDQLRMKDGFELVTVLDVRQVGPDKQWSIVVSKNVLSEDTARELERLGLIDDDE